jgi:SAM-dependent methyltransferase
MVDEVRAANLNAQLLQEQVKQKYTEVALEPQKGFHFHTGSSLALMLGYPEAEIDSLPPGLVESFAGTGNPFSMGRLAPGESVLDLGCGAGFDTLLAARQVGPEGRVIAVDMTEAMVDKVQRMAAQAGLTNVDVRSGYAEQLPVESGAIDVVISNGVINLCPDKPRVMREISRVLRPGGRIQVGDVVLHRELPQDAKDDIDLWSG